MSDKRNGCKDIWNAFMCCGASYSAHDIPFCPTTATKIPQHMLTWTEAKGLYRQRLTRDPNFTCDAFVCFYEDDYKFDGPRGIWHDSRQALKVLCHFEGVITPDFSTYQDFPEPLKLYNTFRMRTYGYWLGVNGIPVINNVRWGTPESFWYCFDGIPKDSIVAIGTVGGSPWKVKDRERFEMGLQEMINVLHPHTILIYGSANYPCFDRLEETGIKVIPYSSHTAKSFERRRGRE